MLSQAEPACGDNRLAKVHPKLLVIGAFPEHAPLDRYIGGGLAERLRAREWQVLVSSRKNHRIFRLADMLKTVLSARAHYELAMVEVYSGTAFLWAELVCLALRYLRKPYVLALHGGNLPAFSQRHPARVCSLLRRAAAVTCPSKYLSEGLRHCGVAVQVVPNPLDIERYPFTERRVPRPNIVWLRAFHEIYNPCLALRIVAHLRETFPEVQMAMAGPDKGDGSLQRTRHLARELNVADRVNFLGVVTKKDVPDILNKADLFINTTNFDNTPVSVIEAMACGLCIVSTNVGGMPYLLQNESEGLLVQRDDSLSMADAIRRLLNDSGLAQRLSRQARLKAQQFDWSVILPIWECLLSNLGRGSGPLFADSDCTAPRSCCPR